ncbi:MAG: hypothetical protein V9E90_16905 [Saprospiraceae bacterium]
MSAEQNSLQACSASPLDPLGPDIFIDLPYGPRWESYFYTIGFMEQGGNFEDLAFEALYDSLYNLPIFEIVRVEQDFLNLDSELSTYNDSLIELDLIIKDVKLEIDEQKLNIIEDSIETGYSLDSLYEVLDSFYILKDNIYLNLLNEKNEIIEQISILNNSIVTTSELEINRIKLNKIKLKLLKNDAITENDSTFLRATSLICDFYEGNNSVIARSILRSYYKLDVQLFNECDMEPLISSHALKSKNYQKLEDLFYIKSMYDDFSSKVIEIYDVLNRKLNTYNDFDELNSSKLIPGLYLLKFKQNDVVLKTTKIWLPIN